MSNQEETMTLLLIYLVIFHIIFTVAGIIKARQGDKIGGAGMFVIGTFYPLMCGIDLIFGIIPGTVQWWIISLTVYMWTMLAIFNWNWLKTFLTS